MVPGLDSFSGPKFVPAKNKEVENHDEHFGLLSSVEHHSASGHIELARVTA